MDGWMDHPNERTDVVPIIHRNIDHSVLTILYLPKGICHCFSFSCNITKYNYIHLTAKFIYLSFATNKMWITYKNTVTRLIYKNRVARIVTCRQDGRGRFPEYGASFPNVAQSYNENPNRVRICIWFLRDEYFQTIQ